MKKVVLFVLVFALSIGSAFAANDFAKKEFKSSAATSAPKEAKPSDMKKKIEELKKELNGSEWQVEMSSGGKSLARTPLPSKTTK